MKTKSVLPQVEYLYVGTTEQIAKLAPIKGIIGPVVLTDVYPGYYCNKHFGNLIKWGIITVSVSNLSAKGLFPLAIDKKNINFSDISPRGKWEIGLKNFGFCLYNCDIDKFAIEKVSIYQPYGREGNSIINKFIEEQNPLEHKLNYEKSVNITKWLNGIEVDSDVLCDSGFKAVKEFNKEISNRSGLDVYYTKPEDKLRKSHKSAAKEQIADDD